jgi:hypothetical protein
VADPPARETDMSAIAERSARGASPILLLLAALCFLLPFVGVSCNTSAGSAALSGALSQAGPAGLSGNSGTVTRCVQALVGRDLATYSGVNLLTGSDPSTVTSLPGCTGANSTPAPSAAASSGAAIGVQPLIVAAAALILVGILATALPARVRPATAGAAALVAAVLIGVDNANVHAPILSRLSAGGGNNLSSLGITGGIDTFFNIHPGVGFTLVLLALALAVAVNAVALVMGSGLRVTRLAASPGPPPPPPPPRA